MAILLLDTTVASFLHPKKRGATVRAVYEAEILGHMLAVSFQTVAELYFWAQQNRWGAAQREALETYISRYIVVSYEPALARAWAAVMTESRAAGRRLEAGDAWIAATAIHRSIPLLTHDKDLATIKLSGLRVITHL